jgi:hypothetical protein
MEAVAELGAVPFMVLPTATQDPPEGQANPAIPTNPGGAAASAQLAPPFALVRKTGAVAPVPIAPPATQAVAEEHETSKTEADENGRSIDVNVLPPSVVSMASPGASGFVTPLGLGPTATQRRLVGHEIEKS